MRRFLRNLVATICVTAVAGCYSWRSVTLEENPDPGTRPEKIRIVTTQGAAFDVYNPVVARDTLKGWTDERMTMPLTVAVSNIANAKTRQTSSGKTALAILGVVAGAVLIVYALLIATFFEAIE